MHFTLSYCVAIFRWHDSSELCLRCPLPGCVAAERKCLSICPTSGLIFITGTFTKTAGSTESAERVHRECRKSAQGVNTQGTGQVIFDLNQFEYIQDLFGLVKIFIFDRCLDCFVRPCNVVGNVNRVTTDI